MSTIPVIQAAIAADITNKVSLRSINPGNVGNNISAVAAEFVGRGVQILANLAALATQNSNDGTTVLVDRVGLFKDSATGPADSKNIFAGVGGRFWVRVVQPSFVNVRDFGAVGDDVTNDRTAIMNAVTAAGVNGVIYIPAGNYFLTGAIGTAVGRDEINLLTGQTIYGDGNASVLRINTNTRVIGIRNHAATVGADYCTIHSLKFKGSGKAAGHTFQTGVALMSGNFFDVFNCTFEDFSGSPAQNGGGGIFCGSIATANSHGGRIGLNYYKNCNGGLVFGQRGEYVTVVGGTAGGCNTGLCVGAGNVYITGFIGEENVIGCDVISGTNDGHGSITGGAFNHNSTRNIRVKDVENHYTFNGVQSYQGNIEIDNTVGVKFIGCDLVGDAGSLTLSLINNSTAFIWNSRYPKTPTGPYLTTTVQAGSTLTEANNVNL